MAGLRLIYTSLIIVFSSLLPGSGWATGAGNHALTLPPPLPQARSNHAWAMRTDSQGPIWLSLTGIGTGKTWQDLQAGGYWWRAGQQQWQTLPAPPGGAGRLAAQLVSADGAFWFFGGYTVAEDGTEVSTPDVFRVEPGTNSRAYQAQPGMPVPVDDAVALVHEDHWVYLISGWHDVGNVNLSQLFDTQSGRWNQAEPWPGAPVFGHAGAIAASQMVICGGAKIRYPPARRAPSTEAKPRDFIMSEECWLGRIQANDPRRINWQSIATMPGGPRYRAAAAATKIDGVDWVLFFGGTLNPYNYDGIGYDGQPALPVASVVGFNLEQKAWFCFKDLSQPSMDHRHVARLDNDRFVLLGGMDRQQQVLNGVQLWQRTSGGQSCAKTDDK